MDQLLKQFGFTPEEITVYKALLKSGGSKVSEVAKATGLKRTSCQEYIKSLEEKGFVNSSKIGKKYYYQAEDPDKFRQIINERMYIVDNLIPKLKTKLEEDWKVRALTVEEVNKKIRRAKRKEQEVVCFGGNKFGGALMDSKTVLLFSSNLEIPAVEIISKDIVEFHKKLLR